MHAGSAVARAGDRARTAELGRAFAHRPEADVRDDCVGQPDPVVADLELEAAVPGDLDGAAPRVGMARHSNARVNFFRQGLSQRENLLYAFRCDLFFEIGANVFPSGEGHHLTILISALRHTVIFGLIKNSPKLGADLTRLWLLMTHQDLRSFESMSVQIRRFFGVGKSPCLTGLTPVTPTGCGHFRLRRESVRLGYTSD